MYCELETQRLSLKNIGYDDLEFIYEEFTDDFINRYLFDCEPLQSLQEAKALIDFYLQTAKYRNHRYVIHTKNNEKIGTIGFHSYDENSQTIYIGYDLKKPYTHQGLMTEAMQALILYLPKAFPVKQIFATIYPENAPSIRLVRSFGFDLFGQHTEWFRGEAYVHDVYRLSLPVQDI